MKKEKRRENMDAINRLLANRPGRGGMPQGETLLADKSVAASRGLLLSDQEAACANVTIADELTVVK